MPYQIQSLTLAISQSDWDELASDYIGSARYAAVTASDNPVAAFFLDLLGRPASLADLDFYNGQMIAGFAPGLVVEEIVNSPEYQHRTAPQILTAIAERVSEEAVFGPFFINPDVGRAPYSPLPLAATTLLIGSAGAYGGGNQFYGVLGGVVPTILAGDSVTGTGGNLLQIDQLSGASAVLPAGFTVSGVQSVVLNAIGNAGAADGTAFDVRGFAGLTSLAIYSSGSGTDYVAAGLATDVTDTSFNGAVSINGGNNVRVMTNALVDISVHGAAGNITLSDNVPFSFIYRNDFITATARHDLTITTEGGVETVIAGANAVVSFSPTATLRHVVDVSASTTANGAPAVINNADGAEIILAHGISQSFNATAVSVTAAMSVAGAFAIAAQQDGQNGAIEWFQWGGNSYLLEIANGAQVEVQLTGLINVGAHGGFNGTALAV